jgi:hypothetical protein
VCLLSHRRPPHPLIPYTVLLYKLTLMLMLTISNSQACSPSTCSSLSCILAPRRARLITYVNSDDFSSRCLACLRASFIRSSRIPQAFASKPRPGAEVATYEQQREPSAIPQDDIAQKILPRSINRTIRCGCPNR